MVGVPFRLQGRSAALGLDCVGVVALAFELPLARVRSNYPLRGTGIAAVEGELIRFFDRLPPKTAGAGDLLLVSPNRRQLHVMLSTGAGYIHADGGLRRVAEVPGMVPWPVLSAWRFRRSSDREQD